MKKIIIAIAVLLLTSQTALASLEIQCDLGNDNTVSVLDLKDIGENNSGLKYQVGFIKTSDSTTSKSPIIVNYKKTYSRCEVHSGEKVTFAHEGISYVLENAGEDYG